MKKISALIVMLSLLVRSNAGSQQLHSTENQMRLKFIDKIEIFVGPNLSFNYGNKFIENYKDANIENTRLLKVGYATGIGFYHSVTKGLDINARFQYEQKGRRTELNTPWTSTSRVINYKDYSYNYLTILVAPQVRFGKYKKWVVSIGVYYSKIKGMKRYESVSFDGQTTEGSAKGRSFEDVDENGGIYTGTWIPELKSFEADDYGLYGSFGYSIFNTEKKTLLIQLVDNLGLKDINKENPYNQIEKNHSICLIISYILKRPIKTKK